MSKDKSTKRAAKRAVSAIRRAVIYVRVSSERQADRVSPETQEADCRALAERQGYQVVAVYRDVEKYRAGGKLVEPSGTRADRPGLRAILADARAGKLDVILAWREDRLYRHYHPMLDVLDCIEQTGIDIELAKETFDKRMMGGKVWVAKMELDAKHDRLMMGVAGRFNQGKVWNGPIRFGYDRVDGVLVENKTEADTVRAIWTWYADGASLPEIRQRLIAAGASQKGKPTKYAWSLKVLRDILHCETYHDGLCKIEWDDETYQIPVPILVDATTAARVKERRASYKAYPTGNLKADALAAGVVYCESCGTRMSVETHHAVSGGGKYDYVYRYYTCLNYDNRRNHVEGCTKRARLEAIDAEIWRKAWDLISVPGQLEAAIWARVAQLQAEEQDAEGECARLQVQLDDLAMRRQQTIAWALDKKISEADMALQLTTLDFAEVEAKHELSEKGMLLGNRAQRLIQLALVYRERITAGIDVVLDPQTDEERQAALVWKQTVVHTLVNKARVKPDKSVELDLELDFSVLQNDDASVNCGEWARKA